MKRSKEIIAAEDLKFRIQKDENGVWIGFRICPGPCGKELKYHAQEQHLVRRNIRDADFENASCLSCSMKGEGNSFFGKKHSAETKEQISISRIGKAMGEDNAMANPVHRKAVSDALTEAYASGSLDFLRKIQSDTAKKNQALGILTNGVYSTGPISLDEKEIKEELEKCGIEVGIQFIINKFRYDLYLKDKNLLIEYNGDYWHCNPEKYSADYIHTTTKKSAQEIWNKDEKKKQLALDSGYNFITIWEKDYLKNKKEIIEKIINYGK